MNGVIHIVLIRTVTDHHGHSRCDVDLNVSVADSIVNQGTTFLICFYFILRSLLLYSTGFYLASDVLFFRRKKNNSYPVTSVIFSVFLLFSRSVDVVLSCRRVTRRVSHVPRSR